MKKQDEYVSIVLNRYWAKPRNADRTYTHRHGAEATLENANGALAFAANGVFKAEKGIHMSGGMEIFDVWLKDPKLTPEQRQELIQERGAFRVLKQMMDDPTTWETGVNLTPADLLRQSR